MASTLQTQTLSRWDHLFDGFQASSQEFYTRLEQAIASRQIPKAERMRIHWKEGGLLSAKREYLRVQRQEFIFDVCAAPFGTGFFVSWWLGELPGGCLTALIDIPLLGFLLRAFVKPITYYKIDTALMFQQTVHLSVLEVLDAMTTAKGVKALTETERKPIMKNFFQ
jgi:hypothetical protein